MKKIKKALLIDDSDAVNTRNKSLLESMDLFEEIEVYSNADKALQFIKNASNDLGSNALPDIIFLDIEMKEMNAFDFLDEYSTFQSIIDSDFKPLIVILSDHLLEKNNFDVLKRYRSIGVCDQLKKPIDKNDVYIIFEDHLSN